MNGAFAPDMYELERNSFIRLIPYPRGRSRAIGSAFPDRHELPALRAVVELARAADLVLGIGDHLLPLRDPADGARERKDAGEHRHGDAQGALHDSGVEIDVRIELALNE